MPKIQHLTKIYDYDDKPPPNKDNLWIADSGCTDHMSNNTTEATNYVDKKRLTIDTAGKPIHSIGRATVSSIPGTLVIPNMKITGLLSISAIHQQRNGLQTLFLKDSVQFGHFKPTKVVYEGPRLGGLYYVDPKELSKRIQLDKNQQTTPITLNNTLQINKAITWHKRLGHTNWRRLKDIRNSKKYPEVKFTEKEWQQAQQQHCHGCITGKTHNKPQHRTSTGKDRPTGPGQQLDMDFGHWPNTDRNKNKYFLVIVDRFSWRIFTTPLLSPSQGPKVFEEWRDRMYRDQNSKLNPRFTLGTNIKSDNDSVFRSHNFRSYCKNSGINLSFSNAHTGHANYAERAINLLREGTRSLLFDAGMPKYLWGDAMRHFSYTHNRTPRFYTRKETTNQPGRPIIKDLSTPLEQWYKRPIQIQHLKPFGCKCMVHLPLAIRPGKKTGHTSKEGLLLGYDQQYHNRYIILLSHNKKITFTANVYFDENRLGPSTRYQNTNRADLIEPKDYNKLTDDHLLSNKDLMENIPHPRISGPTLFRNEHNDEIDDDAPGYDDTKIFSDPDDDGYEDERDLIKFKKRLPQEYDQTDTGSPKTGSPPRTNQKSVTELISNKQLIQYQQKRTAQERQLHHKTLMRDCFGTPESITPIFGKETPSTLKIHRGQQYQPQHRRKEIMNEQLRLPPEPIVFPDTPPTPSPFKSLKQIDSPKPSPIPLSPRELFKLHDNNDATSPNTNVVPLPNDNAFDVPPGNINDTHNGGFWEKPSSRRPPRDRNKPRRVEQCDEYDANVAKTRLIYDTRNSIRASANLYSGDAPTYTPNSSPLLPTILLKYVCSAFSTGPGIHKPQQVLYNSGNIYHAGLKLSDKDMKNTLADSIPTPSNVREARDSIYSANWEKAITIENNAMKNHDVFEIVQRCTIEPDPITGRPRKILKARYVFKTKCNSDGTISVFKARLVVKGYMEQKGIDYDQTFAPTCRATSVRMLLSIAAIHDLHIRQHDVCHAFLGAKLTKQVYMEAPHGYPTIPPGCVLRIKKSLYGLKDAPRLFWKAMDKHLIHIGFKPSTIDPCLYTRTKIDSKTQQREFTMIALIVDDMVVASTNKYNTLYQELQTRFQMKDLGEPEFLLGLRVSRDRNKRAIYLSQEHYIDKLTRLFKIDDDNIPTPQTPGDPTIKQSHADSPDPPRKSPWPYRELVGALLYACTTRPDISYAVGVVCRYGANPGKLHWDAARRILRYLKGTKSLRLCLGGESSTLYSYTDANWVGDNKSAKDTCKSTSGQITFIGNGPIDWSSRLQSVVSLSTTEAEFVASAYNVLGQEPNPQLNEYRKKAHYVSKLVNLCYTSINIIGCRSLLHEIGYTQNDATTIITDSQGSAASMENPITKRLRHIDMRLQRVREAVKNKDVRTHLCRSKDQLADLFTKNLPIKQFELLRSLCMGYGLKPELPKYLHDDLYTTNAKYIINDPIKQTTTDQKFQQANMAAKTELRQQKRNYIEKTTSKLNYNSDVHNPCHSKNARKKIRKTNKRIATDQWEILEQHKEKRLHEQFFGTPLQQRKLRYLQVNTHDHNNRVHRQNYINQFPKTQQTLQITQARQRQNQQDVFQRNLRILDANCRKSNRLALSLHYN